MDGKNGERKAIEPPTDQQATSFFAQELASFANFPPAPMWPI
jgi:hypothetical protein